MGDHIQFTPAQTLIDLNFARAVYFDLASVGFSLFSRESDRKAGIAHEHIEFFPLKLGRLGSQLQNQRRPSATRRVA